MVIDPIIPQVMLAVDEVLELRNEENYMAHAELAGELGYTEPRLKLEEMAADEASQARNFRHILRGCKSSMI